MSQRNRDKEKTEFNAFIKKWNIEKLYKSCCICGWNEWSIDLCHILPAKNGGDYSINNIVPLCPNHHRLLDREVLRMPEIELITKFIYDIYEVFKPHQNVNGSTNSIIKKQFKRFGNL